MCKINSCGGYSITVNGETFPLSYEECVDLLACARKTEPSEYIKKQYGKDMVGQTLTKSKIKKMWKHIPKTAY